MADMLKAFADDLKAVREENNISLRSISQQTRLSLSLLESLESGDFTFQPQAYIRAFLKQYINSIGLDADETLFEYDLARSGKYKTKRINANTGNEDIPRKEVSSETKRSKIRPAEKPKEAIEKQEPAEELRPDEFKIEEVRTEENVKEVERPEETYEPIPPDTNETVKESRVIKSEPPETKPDPRPVQRNREEKYYVNTPKSREKKGISLAFLNSPVTRNIFLVIFAALVLLGLYSLINILFLEGSKDKPEVIRQNFDDVVKEQEKKILGKRTPEEIQDSIKKAEAEFALSKDSITLKVTGLNTGVFYLVTDSVNYNQPRRIEFEKNTVGTFKARNSFFISSPKTETFKASVNDIPLKFDNATVSKVKITRNGIVK